MDPRGLGRAMRAIRLSRKETQEDVARRAGVSQAVYSRVEAGASAGLKLATVESIAGALGAMLDVRLLYQGGLADRLIDRVHASIVEIVVSRLQRAGWETLLEFSFNVFGERGSVDILAWHSASRTLLIVEVKSRFTDLQSMLLSLSRKLRLVPDEVRRQLGWDPVEIGRIVVVPGTTETRGVLQRHRATFEAVLPARSVAIRRWILAPKGPIAGVWLVSKDVLRGERG